MNIWNYILLLSLLLIEIFVEVFVEVFSFLYSNFSFPILILILVILFYSPLLKILENVKEGEVSVGGSVIKVKTEILESSLEYKERFVKKIGVDIDLSKEEISNKIEDLFGKEGSSVFSDEGGGGGPPDAIEGGNARNDTFYMSRLFRIVVDEETLKEDYHSFGYKEVISALYTSYLSTYTRDKWLTKGGETFTISNTDKELEERSFNLITKYYNILIFSDEELDWETVKSYQELIRLVMASYEILKLEFHGQIDPTR